MSRPTTFHRLGAKVSTLWIRFEKWLARFRPDSLQLQGSTGALWIGGAMSLGLVATSQLRLGHGSLVDFLVGVTIFLLMASAIYLATRIAFYLSARFPPRWTAAVLGGLAALSFIFGFTGGPLIMIGLALALMMIGGVIWRFIIRGTHFDATWKRYVNQVLLLLSTIGLGVLLYWIPQRGTTENTLVTDHDFYSFSSAVQLPDLASEGTHSVDYFTYGSGTDRRDEFSSGATHITSRVDASLLVKKPSGRFKIFREWYWGFTRDSFPLNGRVWMPQGPGPFPLVLIVHGNHFMREYSDPGYEYLGKFLGSHGHILVSIDENFLNGDWSSRSKDENDARGWLLLKHLEQWRTWQTEDSHPLEGKADMNRLALIGHSRGGEAVSIAAAFNRLDYYPDNARLSFDFGFDIKSIIAIAQVDGQYKPSGQSTPIRDVSYMALHGSHDADVSGFSGDRQYKRVLFSAGSESFKSSVYIYKANHGQFNTVWGDTDWGGMRSYFLNRAALLDGEDQRKIGKVFMHAFLKATLNQDEKSREFLKDYRQGLSQLPDTYYITRYQDASDTIWVDFEEDIDLQTTGHPEIEISQHRLATWRESDLGFRDGGTRQNKAVFLGWMQDETKEDADSLISGDSMAYYSLALNKDSVFIPGDAILYSIAQVDEAPQKPGRQKEDNDKNLGDNENSESDKEDVETDQLDDTTNVIDLTIIFTDATGTQVKMLQSDVQAIVPPLKAKFTRLKALENEMGKSSEVILQSVRLPVDTILEKEPTFNIYQLRTFTLLFDQSEEGVIAFDEFGRSKDH